MRAKTITGGFGVALLLMLLLAPAAMAQDTAEQPAAVTVEPGLLERLGVDIKPSAELSVEELQVRIAKLTAALKRAGLMHDAKIAEIYEGTSEAQRLVISGSLLR